MGLWVSSSKIQTRPSLQELDEPEYGHLFVKRAVTRALDKHNHEREISSILLSALYGEVSPAQVADLSLQ